MDIAEFTAARIDEDERFALAAIDPRAGGEPEIWRWECTHDDLPLDVDLAIAGNAEFLEHADCWAPIGLRSVARYPAPSVSGMTYGHLVLGAEEVAPQDARHIARHDPARVLREVAAKRKILTLHSPWEDSGDCSACGDVPQVCYPCETLRALAAAWSDHPDYDPAWR